MIKPKRVGLSHVALEVDDVDAALEFYGKSSIFSCAEATAMIAASCRWISWTWRTNSSP